MGKSSVRMGGFVSAKIIAVKDIALFVVENGKCSITPKYQNDIIDLDITKNGVDVQAPSSTSKSGQIFSINIRIELKFFENHKFNSFNKYLALLELPTGETHVFGTPAFPLVITEENTYSKTPSGKQAGILNMAGKQPNNVLILS